MKYKKLIFIGLLWVLFNGAAFIEASASQVSGAYQHADSDSQALASDLGGLTGRALESSRGIHGTPDVASLDGEHHNPLSISRVVKNLINVPFGLVGAVLFVYSLLRIASCLGVFELLKCTPAPIFGALTVSILSCAIFSCCCYRINLR